MTDISAPRPALIDTHCHIQHKDFDADRADVIARAAAAGVGRMFVVGSDRADNPSALALAEQYDFIHAICGIHPHDASSLDDGLKAELRKWLSHPKAIAVGETGLDYHYMHSPREVQREAFVWHLRLARELGLPVVIHSREADDETIEILKSEGRGLRGLLHCFSGSAAMAQEVLALGYYISIAGPVTYKKADAMRDVVKMVPIERLMVETDAPYLAPMPLRGKRNEPACMVHTAAEIARVKGLSVDDVARITSLNAFRLFGVGDVPDAARIAYPIRDSLYLNITNECSNRCAFCIRYRDAFVKGHNLRLEREPSEREIIDAINDPSAYREVVFCGYGEPTLRLDAMKNVCAWLKERGATVRINTNGHANLIHGRNVLPELRGLVDSFSVSLNAANEADYVRICRPDRPGAWQAVLDFIRSAAREGFDVTATAVALPGVDMGECAELARSLGAGFRARTYDEVG